MTILSHMAPDNQETRFLNQDARFLNQDARFLNQEGRRQFLISFVSERD